jgi:hypothetical protein
MQMLRTNASDLNVASEAFLAESIGAVLRSSIAERE